MLPAISSPRRLATLIAMLTTLLALPVILYGIGLPPKAELYRGITREAGTFEAMGRAFFEEQGDVDVLVFGSSLLRAAVDGRMLQSALSTKLGRQAKVLVVGVNWPGVDIQYFLLRDLLAQRRVHMAVMSLPVGQQNTSMPHVQLFRLIRYGDHPDAFAGLSLLNRARLYSAMVLGAPRHAVTMLRPNRGNAVHEADETLRPDNERDIGYYGAPFVPDQRQAPAIPAESLTWCEMTAGSFRFENEMLAPYQMHFLRRIGTLFQEQHVRTVFLNVPLDSDHGSSIMRERLYWPDLFGADTRMVGAPSATLFHGFSDAEFYRFYADQHLNQNGRKYYTAAVLPAILHLYDAP
jgi:hypothetical protein